MAQYILVYLGGNQPKTKEEGQQHFAKYMAWIQSLGGAAISPANPLKDTKTVLSDGSMNDGGTIGMSGYTIIEAESIDEAVKIAKSCPFLEIGGTLEVSERINMPI